MVSGCLRPQKNILGRRWYNSFLFLLVLTTMFRVRVFFCIGVHVCNTCVLKFWFQKYAFFCFSANMSVAKMGFLIGFLNCALSFKMSSFSSSSSSSSSSFSFSSFSSSSCFCPSSSDPVCRWSFVYFVHLHFVLSLQFWTFFRKIWVWRPFLRG